MSPFREIAILYRPKKSESQRFAIPQMSRGSGAQRPGYMQTDARPSRDASERFGSGTQAYAAKFEPAAWSCAQMTSGSGAPKRVLSEEAITFKLQQPN